MLPFYIYYSMFGFQRVGDLIWAAADQRARGFLLGATAGRTTLGGEGLQHQDGIEPPGRGDDPELPAYDPAFAGELAVIVDHGMREMLDEQQDVFYYVTLMNENYAQPTLPARRRGRRPARAATAAPARRPATARGAGARCSGSGAILREVDQAARAARAEHGVAAEVWSVTSFSELARDGARRRALRPLAGQADAARSHVGSSCAPARGPIVAATDYVRAVPEAIRAFLPTGRRFVDARHRRLRPQRHARRAARASSRSTPRRSCRRRCARSAEGKPAMPGGVGTRCLARHRRVIAQL